MRIFLLHVPSEHWRMKSMAVENNKGQHLHQRWSYQRHTFKEYTTLFSTPVLIFELIYSFIIFSYSFSRIIKFFMIKADFDTDFPKFPLKFELIFTQLTNSSEPKIRIRVKFGTFLVFLVIFSFQK